MAKFVKGQTGNPGGRPKQDIHVRDLARAHTAEAIDTLYNIMIDKKQGSMVRVAAANSLLDRGYGRPQQAVTTEDENGNTIPIRFVMNLDTGNNGGGNS